MKAYDKKELVQESSSRKHGKEINKKNEGYLKKSFNDLSREEKLEFLSQEREKLMVSNGLERSKIYTKK